MQLSCAFRGGWYLCRAFLFSCLVGRFTRLLFSLHKIGQNVQFLQCRFIFLQWLYFCNDYKNKMILRFIYIYNEHAKGKKSYNFFSFVSAWFSRSCKDLEKKCVFFEIFFAKYLVIKNNVVPLHCRWEWHNTQRDLWKRPLKAPF